LAAITAVTGPLWGAEPLARAKVSTPPTRKMGLNGPGHQSKQALAID